jgi:hypothetical protein
MAATGYTPISLYYSTTASAIPSAGNLANGELGLNIADMKLYAKNSSGTVTLLASSGGATGTVSSVAVSGGSTGLTTSGGPITTSGTITLAGTLNVANGGTGLTSLTAGYIPYGNGTSALSSSSSLYFDGTNLGVGTSSPVYKMDVRGTGYFSTASGTKQLTFGDSTNGTISAIATSNSNLIFYPNGSTEQFRIGSSGQIGLSGANYGTSGQVLTSAGSGAAPTWATVSSLPSQTGNSGKYLTTDGTNASWATVSGGATKGQAIAFSLVFGF